MSIDSDTPQSPENKRQLSLSWNLPEWLTGHYCLLAFLLLINLICFSDTLSGYFLADDFVHVPFLVQVFHGHPELLLKNFTSNWMQAEGTEFYRPFISLTLALDYSIWKTSAVGYHISNFLYQFASTAFLFLSTRRLFSFRSKKEATQISFFTAAFFAAFPLHAEVVSWIIARVDSVAAAFMLAAFWLYLRSKDADSKKSDAPLSMLAFAVALMSKETAVTLPPALFLLEILRSKKTTVVDKLKDSLVNTWTYWAMLGGYFVVRIAALGTISGGYAGSIGQSLSKSLFRRWFEDGSFWRVFFPINAELPKAAHRTVQWLRILYGCALVLLCARIALLTSCQRLGEWMRWLAFALLWFAIAMLPAYQVWNLTETLQGSRLIYLGTAPLCLLLAIIIAPLDFTGTAQRSKWTSPFTALSFSLSIAFVCCFAYMAYLNNQAWRGANQTVRDFRLAVQGWLEQDKQGKTLAIINVPEQYLGAHMLYNAATLGVLLRPPLSEKDYSTRVATFEPITYGDADLLNISRLRRLLAQPSQYSFTRWDQKTRRLVPLQLSTNAPARTLMSSELTVSQGKHCLAVSPDLDFPAAAADFVDIKLSADSKPLKTDVITMRWEAKDDPDTSNERFLARPLDGKTSVRFFVSEHKKWIASDTIHRLLFELPPHITIENVTLARGGDQIPDLIPNGSKLNNAHATMAEDLSGVSRPGSTIGYFDYDASKIIGADHVVVQISKPDSWFEHYTGTLRDQQLSTETSVSEIYKSLNQDNSEIPASRLDRPGYYEMRIAAVDKQGKVIGYFSDPINLQFSAKNIHK